MMNKYLIRLVSFVLIPCLVSGASFPAGAATYQNQEAALARRLALAREPLFTREAINARPLWVHPPVNHELSVVACSARQAAEAEIPPTETATGGDGGRRIPALILSGEDKNDLLDLQRRSETTRLMMSGWASMHPDSDRLSAPLQTPPRNHKIASFVISPEDPRPRAMVARWISDRKFMRGAYRAVLTGLLADPSLEASVEILFAYSATLLIYWQHLRHQNAQADDVTLKASDIWSLSARQLEERLSADFGESFDPGDVLDPNQSVVEQSDRFLDFITPKLELLKRSGWLDSWATGFLDALRSRTYLGAFGDSFSRDPASVSSAFAVRTQPLEAPLTLLDVQDWFRGRSAAGYRGVLVPSGDRLELLLFWVDPTDQPLQNRLHAIAESYEESLFEALEKSADEPDITLPDLLKKVTYDWRSPLKRLAMTTAAGELPTIADNGVVSSEPLALYKPEKHEEEHPGSISLPGLPATAELIGRLKDRATPENFRSALIQILDMSPEPAVTQAFIDVFRDSNNSPLIRDSALWTCRHRDLSEDQVRTIARVLTLPGATGVRIQAARFLGTFQSLARNDVTKVLTDILRDVDEPSILRNAALIAVAFRGLEPETLDVIRDVFSRPGDVGLRVAASHILRAHSDDLRDIRAFYDAMQDPSPVVRDSATKAMHFRKAEDIVSVLSPAELLGPQLPYVQFPSRIEKPHVAILVLDSIDPGNAPAVPHGEEVTVDIQKYLERLGIGTKVPVYSIHLNKTMENGNLIANDEWLGEVKRYIAEYPKTLFIVNLSVIGFDTQLVQGFIDPDVARELGSQGVIFVAAAGNTGDPKSGGYPEGLRVGYPRTNNLLVGAAADSLKRTRRFYTWYGPDVHFSADPGIGLDGTSYVTPVGDALLAKALVDEPLRSGDAAIAHFLASAGPLVDPLFEKKWLGAGLIEVPREPPPEDLHRPDHFPAHLMRPGPDRDALLDQLVKELASDAQTVFRGAPADFSGALALARRINPDFAPTLAGIEILPTDGASFFPFLRQVIWDVFLPANQFLVIRSSLDATTDIHRATLAEKPWVSLDYLTGRIWVQECRWFQTSSNPLGITLDQIVLVDPQSARFDAIYFYRNRIRKAGLDEYLLTALARQLEQVHISEEDYGRYFGEDRVWQQKIRSAKDAMYASLSLQKSMSDIDSLDIAGAILRPDDTQLRRLILDVSDSGRTPSPAAATAFNLYAADLGGLIAGMRERLDAHRPDLAYLAFLNYLATTAIKAFAQDSSSPFYLTMHQEAAKRFFTGFYELGLGINTYPDLMSYLEQGPESPAERALAMAEKIYKADFLTDEERATNPHVRTPVTSQATTAPLVPGKPIWGSVYKLGRALLAAFWVLAMPGTSLSDFADPITARWIAPPVEEVVTPFVSAQTFVNWHGPQAIELYQRRLQKMLGIKRASRFVFRRSIQLAGLIAIFLMAGAFIGLPHDLISQFLPGLTAALAAAPFLASYAARVGMHHRYTLDEQRRAADSVNYPGYTPAPLTLNGFPSNGTQKPIPIDQLSIDPSLRQVLHSAGIHSDLQLSLFSLADLAELKLGIRAVAQIDAALAETSKLRLSTLSLHDRFSGIGIFGFDLADFFFLLKQGIRTRRQLDAWLNREEPLVLKDLEVYLSRMGFENHGLHVRMLARIRHVLHDYDALHSKDREMPMASTSIDAAPVTAVAESREPAPAESWAQVKYAWHPLYGRGKILQYPTIVQHGDVRTAQGPMTVQFDGRQYKKNGGKVESFEPDELFPVVRLDEIPNHTKISIARIRMAHAKHLLPEGVPGLPDTFFWTQIPAISDDFILKEPEENYLDSKGVAIELHKQPTWAYAMTRLHLLTPDQAIWTVNFQGKRPFFLKRNREERVRRYDPEHYPDAYYIDDLVAKLEMPRGAVYDFFATGTIQPAVSGTDAKPKRLVIGTIELEMIGSEGRPAYIVPPKAMQQLKRAMTTHRARLYLKTAAHELGVGRRKLRQVAEEAQVEIKTDLTPGKHHGRHRIAPEDFKVLKDLIPRKPSSALISVHKLAERIGASAKVLRRRNDLVPFPRGKFIDKYLYLKRLPMYLRSRKAYREWTQRKRKVLRKVITTLLLPLLAPAAAGLLGLHLLSDSSDRQPPHLLAAAA